jgi:hypothetical protein
MVLLITQNVEKPGQEINVIPVSSTIEHSKYSILTISSAESFEDQVQVFYDPQTQDAWETPCQLP